MTLLSSITYVNLTDIRYKDLNSDDSAAEVEGLTIIKDRIICIYPTSLGKEYGLVKVINTVQEKALQTIEQSERLSTYMQLMPTKDLSEFRKGHYMPVPSFTWHSNSLYLGGICVGRVERRDDNWAKVVDLPNAPSSFTTASLESAREDLEISAKEWLLELQRVE